MTTAATGLPDRFTTPLYTVTEAARYLDVPASTLAAWTHGHRRNAAGGPKQRQPPSGSPGPSVPCSD